MFLFFPHAFPTLIVLDVPHFGYFLGHMHPSLLCYRVLRYGTFKHEVGGPSCCPVSLVGRGYVLPLGARQVILSICGWHTSGSYCCCGKLELLVSSFCGDGKTICHGQKWARTGVNSSACKSKWISFKPAMYVCS